MTTNNIYLDVKYNDTNQKSENLNSPRKNHSQNWYFYQGLLFSGFFIYICKIIKIIDFRL